MEKERLSRLNECLEVLVFDRELLLRGRIHIIIGLINLMNGILQIVKSHPKGYFMSGLGLFLITYGIYETKIRKPYIFKLAAFTMGLTTLWYLGNLIYELFFATHTIPDYLTLYIIITNAYVTFITWKTYFTYKMHFDRADPETMNEVRQYLKQAQDIDPDLREDVMVFNIDTFIGSRYTWRLVPVEDVILCLGFKKDMHKYLEVTEFITTESIRVELLGEKFMSKNMQAKVTIDKTVIEEVTIEPEMLSRMEKQLGHSLTMGSSVHSLD